MRPAGVTTQTVRVVTPVNAGMSVGTPTIVGGVQGPRLVTVQNRLVTVRISNPDEFVNFDWRKAVAL